MRKWNNWSTKGVSSSWRILLVMVMLLAIAGCSNKKEGQQNKGRYVEKEVILPELGEDESILQIGINEEGGLRVYSIIYKDSNKKADIYQYDMTKEQTFTKSKTEWLQNLDIEDIDTEKSKYILDGGNVQYAYFNCYTDGVWTNRVYQTKDGKVAEILKVKAWDKKKENQESVMLGATHSGKLYEQTSSDLMIYDETKQDFVSVLDIQDYSRSDMSVGGDRIILYSEDKNGEIKQYVVWNEEELDKAPQTYDVDSAYDVYGFVDKDNDIVMVDNSGIHQIVDGTLAAQTVVDGSMNMMYAVSSYPKDIVSVEGNNYYVLYYLIERDDYQLMEYTYDVEVASVPEKTLTVYSLNYDLWTREAATIFQREHPELRVELRVAMDENATATQEDYIRQLNTELLNGNGPDILVMDDLPLDSYISKGVILDIRDVITPMLENGELLKNVAANFMQEDGSYYTMPANMELPMMLAQKEAVEESASLSGIASYVQEYDDPFMVMGKQSWSNLIEYFLPVYMKSLINNKEVDTQQITEFLENLQIIYEAGGYVEEEKDEAINEALQGAVDMIKGLQMSYVEGRGFYDICLEEGIGRTINGKLSVINQTYYPISCMSINKSSENVELAKEFIQCVLSQKLQESEFQTGFSVNPKALEKRKNDKKKQKSMQWEYEIPDKDGNNVNVPYGWPSDSDIDKYIEMCKSVTTIGDKNRYLIDTFVENSTDFAEGKESSYQAARRIVEKLKMYLKE